MEEEKKFNEIDMECNIDPDEDDGFGGNYVSKEANIKDDTVEPISGNDDRDLVKNTGIILDFGDGEEVNIQPEEIEVIEQEPIKVQMKDDGLNFDLPQHPEDKPFKGFNEIDMECEIPDDYEAPEKPISNAGAYLDFGDEEEQDKIDRQLVSEQIVEESKREAQAQIDQGDVEDDFYDKLKKKHAATNKKGAYNYHFHLSGNPKAEAEMFNHDMTPGKIPNITNVNSGAVGDDGMTVASQGMGMCEGYNKLFEELLFITGCEGNKNEGK